MQGSLAKGSWGRFGVASMAPMQPIADRLTERLRAVASPERAAGEKAYLKSDLDFLGATVSQIRAAVREAAREQQSMTHRELVALAEALWSVPLFERRMAAVKLLAQFSGLLGVRDLDLIRRLVRESRTWALVDGLAGDVLGALVGRDPDGMKPAMDGWASDDHFWVRRASLLAELRPIRAGAPLDRFLGRAEQMLDEREFFVRKAIGWVLREAGKRRPGEVAAWLAPRTHRTSGVTIREAVKYLPAGERERLMAAYRERRPAV
jgi:3-methyladenine DNA glycosylase AlkD